MWLPAGLNLFTMNALSVSQDVEQSIRKSGPTPLLVRVLSAGARKEALDRSYCESSDLPIPMVTVSL